MLISAIVPVYNSINTLERAVNSLLIQAEINEIFLIDDGSSDGSFELALHLESRSSIIKVLTHPHRINKGASASRNLGLIHCTNDWIQFLDADDELLGGKISSQINNLDSDTSLVLGHSLWKNSKRIRKEKYDSNILNGLLIGYIGNTCSNLWSKKYIDLVGGWDECLINTQEHELVFRIYKMNSNFKYSRGFLTLIHETPNSLTRNSDNIILRIKNQYDLRYRIWEYIKPKTYLTLPYKINLAGYIGTLLRNNDYVVDLEYSKSYYFLFKVRKYIADRFSILFKK